MDTELARIQAFVLDPVGPYALDEEGDPVTLEEARSAIMDSLRLLGTCPTRYPRSGGREC